jgi:hypothetical protein
MTAARVRGTPSPTVKKILTHFQKITTTKFTPPLTQANVSTDTAVISYIVVWCATFFADPIAIRLHVMLGGAMFTRLNVLNIISASINSFILKSFMTHKTNNAW